MSTQHRLRSFIATRDGREYLFHRFHVVGPCVVVEADPLLAGGGVYE